MWSKTKAKEIVFSLSEQRSQRILQIAIACFTAVGLASLVAKGSTQAILLTAMFFLLVASVFAWRGNSIAAASVLLLDMALMLSVLVWVSGGVHDIGMLGYPMRSEEHTSELQSRPHLVCRLLLEKKNNH